MFHLGCPDELSYYNFAREYFDGSPLVLPSKLGQQHKFSSLETFVPTFEPQYNDLLSVDRVNMGLMANHTYSQDPARLSFTLSRYKFVSKMLQGFDTVLEIGCADAFGSPLVLRQVNHLTCCDIDHTFINTAKRTHYYRDSIAFVQNDYVEKPLEGSWDGIFLLDVLEHINPSNEDIFLSNIIKNLNQEGAMIVGIPSLESQAYASPLSKQGHVNCKSGMDLKRSLSRFFSNVFVFSMNDEVVHTGFYPMAHYLLALCCSPFK